MVDTLNNMLGELKQIRSEIAECERKSNDLISNMSAISAQKAKYVSELERIRQEIAELRKVTVYCCANGQVDVENAEIPTDLVSDEEIKNKAKQLFAKAIDEGIDVNVKEVHALAILLYIIAYLNRSKLPWECAFDNENMEALFED